MVPLMEVSEINPRGDEAPKLDEIVSFIPMSAVSAESGTIIDEKTRTYAEVAKGYTPFASGDILVAKITPCFENGKIAQAMLSRSIGFGSTEFHVIRPFLELLDPRYLLYYLRQDQIRRSGERRMTGSAGQRRVPERFLSKLTIPLPSLPEQQKIAKILDKAGALRTKCRAALAQLDELAHSIFLEMFGERAVEESAMSSVAGVASQIPGSIRTGPFGSQLLHSEFTDSGIAVLGIDNAVNNEFRWGERRYISERKYQQLERYTVHPGDILITIMGTCGRCAIVPNDIPLAINTKHLCCITLHTSKCLPVFLHAYFLQHPIVRRYLTRKAKGAIMSGLNMDIIKDLPVPLVPIGDQQEFARRIEAIEALKSQHRTVLEQFDELFASLQQRAFRGEL